MVIIEYRIYTVNYFLKKYFTVTFTVTFTVLLKTHIISVLDLGLFFMFIIHLSSFFSCSLCSVCDLSLFTVLLAVSLYSESVSQTWKHLWTVVAPQTVLTAHCSAVATEPSLHFLLQSCSALSKTGSFHL